MQETGLPKDTALTHSLAHRTLRDTPPQGGQSQPSSTPPGGVGGSAGPSAFILGNISSAIALVKSPGAYMTANKDAPATTGEIMLKYVAVLAAIPFLATLIGDIWYYSLYIPFGFAGSFVAYAFTNSVLSYILDVLGVYVIAVVIRMLAPTFSSTADEIKSLRLAAFIFTPVFLIGILDIIPLLAILTILGVIYGLYILYLGLPIMLGTSQEKTVTYVVAVVIATFVVYLVIGAIVGAVSAAVFHVGMGFL